MIYLKYILYWFVTQDNRLRYQTGVLKGYQCTGLKHGAMGTIAEYDTTRKPERDYLTWTEFKQKQKDKK